MRALLRDFFNLLNHKLALYLVVGAALQVAYWHLGSPGPQLRGAPRTFGAASQNVIWAFLLLLVAPVLLMRLLGDAPRRAGLRLGDAAFAVRITLIAALIAVPVLYIGSSFPELQAAYPWAGDWPGRTPLHLLAWVGLYALYYLSFEFFYRGFLLRALEPNWGLSAAIWTQTLASTLMHLGKPVSETVGAIPMGLLFGLLAVWGRSLLAPFLVHLSIGVLIDVFSLMRQGQLFP